MLNENPPEWEGMEASRRAVIVAAEAAMAAARQGFDNWVAIGAGFHELQLEAMARSNSNRPNGRRYADAYRELEQPTDQLRTFDPSDRKKVIDLYLDRDAVRSWFYDDAKVSQRDRDRWNHPSTIMRHYMAATSLKHHGGECWPGDGKRDGERRARGQAAAIDEATGDLRHVVDDIQHITGGTAASSFFDLSPQLITESARNFIDIYGRNDTRRFVDALMAVLGGGAPLENAADELALDKIRAVAAGRPWVGPQWLADNEIEQAVIERLLERGALVKHPERGGHVGLS
jgi:hypothetical protein